MKIIVLACFLYLSPLIGQTLSNNLDDKKADSLFLPESKSLTFADSLRNAIPKKQSDVSGYLYKVILVTFFLILFLVAGLYLYKKFILKNEAPLNSTIRIIARQNLSAKQSILVVTIENKKYALGVTEQQVNLITELGEVTDADNKMNTSQPLGFGQILKKLTTKQ